MSANNEREQAQAHKRGARLPDLLDELDGWTNASSFPTKERVSQVGCSVARQVLRASRLDELDRGYVYGDDDEEY